MKWWPSVCTSGDMIRVKLGSVYHYGVYVSDQEVIQFGEPPVGNLITRDASQVKVCKTDIDSFSCGKIIEVAQFDRREKRSRIKPEKTVALARSRIGEGGYNLIHNNCEHFAYECVLGIRKCTQEEEARLAWQQRPILNVYFSKIPENPESFSELPEMILKKSGDPTERFVWHLLDLALFDCFGKKITDYSFKKKLFGGIVFDGFCYDMTVCGDIAAVAVSKTDVKLTLENSAFRGEKRKGIKRGFLGGEYKVYAGIRNSRADIADIKLCDGSMNICRAGNLFEEF